MALPAKAQTKYTYQDYLQFPENLRCELIEGEIYMMTPSPFVKHQALVRNLAIILGREREKLKAKGCDFFVAPLDVVLDEHNVVQPDLFIVCGPLEEHSHIFQVPLVIFEVLSKNTAFKDIEIKRKLYERFQVKEYILIFLDLEIVQHFILTENSTYGEPKIYNWEDTLKLHSLEIEIPLKELFERGST